MKNKRMFAILLTITFLFSVIILGLSFGKAATSKKLITITTHTTSSQPPAVTDLYKKKLREKFSIDLKTIYIPQSDFVTKMSLLFASNMAPDWIRTLRPEYNLNEWIAAGYLIGFTQDEIKKKWPNYLKIWTKEEWDYLYKVVRYSDGKVYSFHGKRIAPVDMAFLYRKEIFDRYNLKFPTTVNEFYKTCIFLRQKTGKVVYLHANPVAGQLSLWAFTGIFLMYGLPELAPRQISYVDQLTKKFVPFAFNQNNYRQALILINKLYKAGCIWKEYATATRDQLDKFRTQGQGIIMWAYPANIPTYNNLYRNTDKEYQLGMVEGYANSLSGKGIFLQEESFALCRWSRI
ncbi:extracellular solute-binding protein [Anaerocellum danielii]|uniref:Extracellular solute-binding protein n=1 Tax=Anaerocellum danielii TaxID=1387557 RepID=A0ABZ0TXS8_9FIRM|nr:extracellular solute-binding protein [Caldicellulosiruptor danielii]WPX08256.1 extracellular solute-binding protein [Caldicellulosiruptor danielii]